MMEWFLWLMFDPLGLITYVLGVCLAMVIVVVALRSVRRDGRGP